MHDAEAYLAPIQTSQMEIFSENSQQPKAFNYFSRKLHRICSTGFYIRVWQVLVGKVHR